MCPFMGSWRREKENSRGTALFSLFFALIDVRSCRIF
jgi:hypothetical protein